MENKPDKNNSGTLLAILLIVIGVIWLVQRSVTYLNLPNFYWNNFYLPIRPAFHGIRNLIFSWPVIFIIVGLVLMAGRRKSGTVFIFIGGIFLIPKIIHIPLITATLIVPVALITIGVLLITKFLTNKS